MAAAKSIGIDQDTLNTMEYYLGGTVEELLAIYRKYTEIEINKAYSPPLWVKE
jgi:hypothetical protein